MGLGRLVKRIGKVALKATPAGRTLSLAGMAQRALSGAKRVARAGISTSPGLMAAVSGAVARKRRRRRKGLTDKEMANLLKLQMFVSKKSIPYQLAVMKAMK